MENQISLIFNNPDGILHDLISILKDYSIEFYPNELFLADNVSKRDSIKCFKLNYDSEIRSKIENDSKLVIFIVNNDSIRCKKCIELIQLSRKLKIPIISLIVEEIQNLDEIKSTILAGIDHYFEVYKDRVHKTGYDEYIWLGEGFQNFRKYMKIGEKEILLYQKLHFLSYSMSSVESAKNIKNMLYILDSVGLETLPTSKFDFLVDKNCSKQYTNITRHENRFDNYEIFLRWANIDENLIDDYLAIIRTFDNVIENSKIFDNKNSKAKNFFPDYKYSHINRHVEEILDYISIDERITLHFKEEMKKHGIELDLLNQALGILYSKKGHRFLFENFLKSKTVIFLLTNKEYYESRKFQKLYYEAKRMRKRIFLVKLTDFDLNLNDGYNRLHVHDISKHENFGYDGYLTKNFLKDAESFCDLNIKGFKFRVWNEIFISTCNNRYTQEIECLKSFFTNKNLRVRCKFDIIEFDIEDIERSKILIFCLTNKYLASNEFQNEFSLAKRLEKTIFFLLMEEISFEFESIDLSLFNVIEFDKIYRDFTFKGEMFYRLCYFVYSLLDFKQNKVSFDGKLVYVDDDQAQKCSLYPKDQLFTRGKMLKKIEIDYQRYVDLTYIKNLNSYCVLTRNHCYFYDDKFVRINQYQSVSCVGSYEAVLYDEINGNIYLAYQTYGQLFVELYNNAMELMKKIMVNVTDRKTDLKIFKDKIYIVSKNEFLVYDLELQLISEIPYPLDLSKNMRIQMEIEHRCENYIYLIDPYNRVMKAFNVNGFKFNQKMDLPLLNFIFDKNRITNNLEFDFNIKDIEVYEIRYNRIESAIDRKLSGCICQLNKYPPHLLKHPYVLPCGSLACLECIYENYNLYLNKFICAACGNNEHQQLNNQMEKSTLIVDNLKLICELQIDNLKRGFEKDFMEVKQYLENCYKYSEEDIEIRIESLKIAFDELEEIQVKFINRLEEKLLKNSYKNKKMAFKKKSEYKINKEIISESKIGLFNYVVQKWRKH